MAICLAWVAGRRSHLPQVVHRIVRQVRHAHLLENELLEVIVRLLPPMRWAWQTIEAIVLMTDSGTARVISAGSQPK